MTYDAMLGKFEVMFPSAEIDDYRPACQLFTEEKEGITIWLKNGDIVVYYPKVESKKDVLDKIKAEITAIVINGQIDEHTAFIRTAEQIKQMALDVIDKYKAEKWGIRNE